MALVLSNRVQETGTANTTVSFTLTGAVLGFQTFAVVGNGNTTYYAATDASGNWEVGLGTYSTTGPTLTRTTIYGSSNAGSAVTFSGSVNVFLTYPSGKSVNLDASGNVSALGTVASGTWQGSTVDVAYGGTGVTTSSGANSVVLRDSNQNITVNRLNQSSTTTTAAAGTTTLTAASTFSQILVGTGGQTFKLPDATTLTNTTTFEFNNNATGTLTITDNASATVGTISPGGAAAIALLSNGTVGGTWDVHAYIPENVTWGTNALVLGSTVITGGTWNGGTITSGYGGTGLTTFAGANNALYSTSASALAAGTLPVAAGGTGLTSTPANGALDIGNGSGFTRTTLTAGTGISVTNGSGSITIASSVTPVTSVTGTSPVASSGGTTPAISLSSGYGDTQNPYASKTANYVLAAPNGSAGVPSFRALVAADIPFAPSISPRVYTIPDTSGTAQWAYIGRWSGMGQSGAKLDLHIVASQGFNANTSQNQVTDVFFKTSNNSSSQSGSSGSYYADGMAWRYGPNTTVPSVIRVIQVNSDTYDFYFYISTYTGYNSYYIVSTPNGSWTNSGTFASPSGNYIDLSIYAVLDSSNYSSYALPLSGGTMTGSIANNQDGGVIVESNASEANNWLWKEYVKTWGIFYFNKGSQSGQTIGTYTTIGAETFYMGGSSGIAMPSGWTGYQSGSYITAMISHYTGYIYSASTVYAASSMYSPILYDANNTAYYVDPSSTGISVNTVGSGVFGNGGSDTGLGVYYGAGSGDYARIRFYQNGTNNQTIHVFSTTWQSSTLAANSTGAINISGANGVTLGGWNVISSLGHWFDNSGNGQSSASFRSPIFYDSNDTGYYVDPNSYTFLYYTSVNVGNESTGGANSSSAGLVLRGNYNSNTWAHKFHKYDNGNGVPLYLSTTTGAGSWTAVQGWTTGLSYTSVVYGSFAANSSVYSPILYDLNNTGYYCDPNSTSSMVAISVDRVGVGNSNVYDQTNNSPWYGIGNSNVGGPYGGTAVQVGGYYGVRIQTANGNMQFEAPSYGGGGWSYSSYATAISNQFRSTIFYDYNDTGYYVDPAASTPSINVYGNIECTARSSSWAEGIRIWCQTAGTWGGIRITRSTNTGNWAIGYTGLNSTDDLTFYSGTSNSILLNLTHAGNLTASGNVTAYSDENLKKDWDDLPSDFVPRLAQVKNGTYTRIDSDIRQIGVGAQSLKPLMSEAVLEGSDGILSVAYGNAALASAVELAKYVVALERRILQLEMR